MPLLHIDQVYTKQTINPMILNFQNGVMTNEIKSVPCDVFECDKTKKKIIATVIGQVIYCGTEEDEEMSKNLLIVRNKKSGKVKIIEVSHVQMKPQIITTDLDTSQLLETSNLELSRKFGSKKLKQKTEQREKLKVNVQTVTEQMQNVTSTISDDTLDLSSYIKNDSDEFYIPPMDKSAAKVENVYEMDKILTPEDYEKIASEIEDKDYTADFLPWIKNMMNKNLSQYQIILAIYANALLKLFTTLFKDLTKKSFIVCQHSVTLNELIFKNFTTVVNGRRNRPTPYKDKALCHAIVCLLLINNFKFELDGLCECVKMTPATVSTKVKVTGAYIVSNGDKKLVQLKLPLNTRPSGFRRKSAKF